MTINLLPAGSCVTGRERKRGDGLFDPREIKKLEGKTHTYRIHTLLP